MIKALALGVVLYRFSTSNHNPHHLLSKHRPVVLYRFSTSNHNNLPLSLAIELLYYIVSLHQTTTRSWTRGRPNCCIISFLYIKPQLSMLNTLKSRCCIISFLYIKPQLSTLTFIEVFVVLYRFSTSNHNSICTTWLFGWLYYIVSLHQTTTRGRQIPQWDWLYYIVSLHQTTTKIREWKPHPRCIISFLYIKPQLFTAPEEYVKVVLYRFSTSNHNVIASAFFLRSLYYIVSLHQTTTISYNGLMWIWLYYIVSLHQTTTPDRPIGRGLTL